MEAGGKRETKGEDEGVKIKKEKESRSRKKRKIKRKIWRRGKRNRKGWRGGEIIKQTRCLFMPYLYVITWDKSNNKEHLPIPWKPDKRACNYNGNSNKCQGTCWVNLNCHKLII